MDMYFTDGTPYEPPINPLEKKWKELYPPIPKPEYSQVCDGYSCMWCGRCPEGELWKVSEEDREIYDKYLMELKEYVDSHGGLEELMVPINLGENYERSKNHYL